MHKKLISVCLIGCCLFASFLCSPASARDPENCLFCHKYRRMRVFDEKGSIHNYYVDTHLFHTSIHREVTCVGCHNDITKVPHGAVEKVNCAKECHLDRYKSMSGTNFSHRSIEENIQKSVHGVKPDDSPEKAKLKPTCKYCHLNSQYTLPDELPSDKVLKRCLNCHSDKSLKGVFSHISHRFKRKTSRSPMEVVQLCASCHEDKDFNNAVGLTGPKAEAVDTYKETIHYRILQLGGKDTADCISCHVSESIHDIRPASDPQSSVYPDRRYQTCQNEGCHPAASPKIAAVDSHLTRYKEKGPEIRIVEIAMEAVMVFTLAFLFLLMIIETYGRLRNKDARFFRWLRKPQPVTEIRPVETISELPVIPNLHRYVDFNPKGDYPRYSIHIIINHSLMVIAFTVAVATGLPLFFHNAALSRTVIDLMGGIDITRKIHRINAMVFTFTCLYHLLVLVFGSVKKMLKGTFNIRRTQVPIFKDAADLYYDMRYFLGLEKTRPKMEKFMYKQKIHYLANIWGCCVLTLSGCCLLFPEFMAQYLPFPKVSVNILRLMHAEESVLATLVITLWHLYNVHIAPGRFPVQWTFWNGKINKDHQIEEHYLEYERQVKEGIAEPEEYKLLGKPVHQAAPRVKRSLVESFLVFAAALVIALGASGYLTFKVQFEKKKAPPLPKSVEQSYQTLRIKDQERRQIREHFHMTTEDINLEAWADKDSCIACHSPYPHGKKSKAKALMNLHTEFLTCQSCHLKINANEEIKFGWINPTAVTPKGKPYGTTIDPVTKLLAQTDDHYSKLTPIKKVDGAWSPVMPAPSSAIDIKPGVDPKYMEKWKALHAGTELEHFVKCTSCHSPSGIMNFRDLGFDAARINQLEKLEVSGMFTNYETFYFPDIFKEKF